jgi:hypothetical protein
MADINQSEKNLLEEFVNGRRALILSLQSSKGLQASGLSASLLRTEQSGNIAKLIDAAGYFEFQEFGRRGGGMPPFKAIYDWLQFKKYGLNYANDKERKSLAWAIMMKIRKSGTHTHITQKPTGVLSESLNDQLLHDFIIKLASHKASEIKTDILRLNL